jgi:hypothetical protein
MNRARLAKTWNDFLFRPVPAYPLGLFRIALAAVILLDLALLFPDTLVWYSEHGPVPIATAVRMSCGHHLDLLAYLPASDLVTELFFGFFAFVTLLLLVGFHTRTASVLVWICVATMHHRNLYILNSGDTLMRNLSLLLIFAPADKAFSVDRYLRRCRGIEPPGEPQMAAWPLRLLRFQLCVMYLMTVGWKLMGPLWVDGTAVYFTSRLLEFQRFPVPEFLHSLWAAKFLTWSTLAVELALGALIWMRPLKYPVLLAGAMLHLGLEYTMIVPVFQWMVLASYCLFLDPEVIGKVIRLDPPLRTAGTVPWFASASIRVPGRRSASVSASPRRVNRRGSARRTSGAALR